MDTDTEYTVVEHSGHRATFCKEVMKMIAANWEPIGGVCVVYEPSAYKFRYVQSMIRKQVTLDA